MVPESQPSTLDKDLVQLHLDFELKKTKWEKLCDLLLPPVLVVASSLPIWALAGVMRAVAGKETTVNLTWSVSISLALAGIPSLVYFAVVRRKVKRQGQELIRLRARIQELEGSLLRPKEQGK